MKISELKSGMNNVTLKAKVIDLTEPKEVTTKFGTTTTLTVATIEDESGEIKLTLWGKSADGIERGSEIQITGGFVKEFRDEPQLGIGRGGSVKVIS